MLFSFTIAVNFIALSIALWLGLYVITRSSRSLVAWLTGLTMWSIAGLFLNVLLALNPPPVPEQFPDWLRLLLTLRYEGALEAGSSDWLQGWWVAPAIMLWHHVTMLMRPGPLNPWRWARILAGYGLAAAAIYFQSNTALIFEVTTGDPLYINALQAGPLYLFFFAALVFYTAASLYNLIRSARIAPAMMPRKQLLTLIAATLVAGLAGPLAIAGSATPRTYSAHGDKRLFAQVGPANVLLNSHRKNGSPHIPSVNAN